jgi:hypothetical protein
MLVDGTHIELRDFSRCWLKHLAGNANMTSMTLGAVQYLHLYLSTHAFMGLTSIAPYLRFRVSGNPQSILFLLYKVRLCDSKDVRKLSYMR